MKSARWFVIEIVVAIMSSILGWLLPDGLNYVAHILQQKSLAVTPVERFLSALVIFLFVTTIQLIITTRETANSILEELPMNIQKLLDKSVLSIFLDRIAQSPQGIESMERIVAAAMSPLSYGNIALIDARAVIIERALASATQDIQLISNTGLDVDIFDNNEITMRLASRCYSYKQIQRKAYQVPGEWTQTWMRFVAELGAKQVSCEYVVLIDRQTAVDNRKKLDSMQKYLCAHNWTFYYCDLKDVLDSLGGVLPTDWNLEVFDRQIIKIQETPAGFYHGGIRLKVALYGLDERAEMRRMAEAVAKHSRKYPAGLFRSP
jgi:hypothetical protein